MAWGFVPQNDFPKQLCHDLVVRPNGDRIPIPSRTKLCKDPSRGVSPLAGGPSGAEAAELLPGAFPQQMEQSAVDHRNDSRQLKINVREHSFSIAEPGIHHDYSRVCCHPPGCWHENFLIVTNLVLANLYRRTSYFKFRYSLFPWLPSRSRLKYNTIVGDIGVS